MKKIVGIVVALFIFGGITAYAAIPDSAAVESDIAVLNPEQEQDNLNGFLHVQVAC